MAASISYPEETENKEESLLRLQVWESHCDLNCLWILLLPVKGSMLDLPCAHYVQVRTLVIH